MTQTVAILNHMKRGHILTQASALNLFGTSRLAARIHEIERMGFRVRRDLIRVRSGKRVARYWL